MAGGFALPWAAALQLHPPKPIRELRDLTRYRRKLVEAQTAERNRLLKVLEGANIKLASVATDVFGVSERLMLRALIEGIANPEEMAELAKGQLRHKIAQLQPALEGKLEQHHRFLLELQLQRVEAAERDLATLQQRIQQKLEPYAAQLALLDQIPGVDRALAAVIIAELGVGHDCVPNRIAPGFLGRRLPGQQRIRGQTEEQPHNQGQRVSEIRVD
jgi:transposase